MICLIAPFPFHNLKRRRLASPTTPRPEPAMAIAMRPSHLDGLICLCLALLLHLLARATTCENLLVRGCATTSLPPRGSVLPLGSDSDAPPTPQEAAAAISRLLHLDPVLCVRPHAPPSPSTSRRAETAVTRLDVGATASPRVTPPRPCGSVGHKSAASAGSIETEPPRGVTTPSKTKAALVGALLPLLAVPFLPPPVAALVALSSLATPVRAWSSSDCSKLTHAACDLYKYDNETGTVDRRRPDPTVSTKCEHPLRHAADAYERAAIHAQEHGRGDDPLLIYCSFHVLKWPPSILPWLNEDVTHMPIADPAAAAASGDRVCYVELTHLAYREGYYIRCPSPYSEGRVLTCTEFPEEEIAAAVWEHRRLNYRDTVWPRFLTPAPAEKHDEL
ncbi:unnamed protein product [Urochloa decumbens]|uniref:Uncharacterized protein n=1 Tax=Urochloa decumbens TaxID=240449 RepID=A0ABC9BBX2_9POAL